jgi:hypothetical protein
VREAPPQVLAKALGISATRNAARRTRRIRHGAICGGSIREQSTLITRSASGTALVAAFVNGRNRLDWRARILHWIRISIDCQRPGVRYLT